jgi:hypothetical protein
MNPIEQTTLREQDNLSAQLGARAIKHVILTFRDIYHTFWNRDPPQIVETMNSNVALYLERFSENTAIGNFMNARAEKLGFIERIPTKMPDGYFFDSDSMQFSYTAPFVEIVEETNLVEDEHSPEL